MRWVWRRLTGAAVKLFPTDVPPDRLFRFVVQGIHVEVPRALLTPPVWASLCRANYESDETRCLAAVLRPGDTLLEIGAGLGLLSALAKKQLGAGRVLAVEANPDLVPVIHRTHALNDVSAEVLSGVAGRADGEVTFHVQSDFWASSVHRQDGGRAVRVRQYDLAALVAAVRPDVLVADVEGGEADLFQDIDLRGVRHVMVELHEPAIGLAGIARCLAALTQAGFTYDPRGSHGAVVTCTRLDPPVAVPGGAAA